MDYPEQLVKDIYEAMCESVKNAYERKHDPNVDPEDQLWYPGKVDALRPILAMIQYAGYPKLEIKLVVVNEVPDPIVEPGTSEVA